MHRILQKHRVLAFIGPRVLNIFPIFFTYTGARTSLELSRNSFLCTFYIYMYRWNVNERLNKSLGWSIYKLLSIIINAWNRRNKKILFFFFFSFNRFSTSLRNITFFQNSSHIFALYRKYFDPWYFLPWEEEVRNSEEIYCRMLLYKLGGKIYHGFILSLFPTTFFTTRIKILPIFGINIIFYFSFSLIHLIESYNYYHLEFIISE